MALPYAFSQAGWLAGLLCLTFMGLRSYYTMKHILNCVHATRIRLRRLQLEARYGVFPDQHHSSHHGIIAPKPSYGSVHSTAGPAVSINGLPILPPSSSPESDEFDASADPEYEVIGYQQIANVVWGKVGRRFVDFNLVLAQVRVRVSKVSASTMHQLCTDFPFSFLCVQ